MEPSQGLADSALLDAFRQNGQAETADSWVSTGPNKPVQPDQIQAGHWTGRAQ
jgi:uncharacterized protein YidB (DUF937 family)